MRPEYYGGEDNTYEVIKVIRAWGLGFELGNCLKYIGRAGKKDKSKALEDLQKAKTFIDMEIQRLVELDTVPFSILDGSIPQQIREKEEELKKTQDKCDRVSALEKESIEKPVSREEIDAMIEGPAEQETFLDFMGRRVIEGLEEDFQNLLFKKEKAEDKILSEQASVFYELSDKIKEANEGWTPNWDDKNEEKWYPWFDLRDGKVTLGYVCSYYYSSFVPPSLIFKSEEICKKFVEENMELYEKLYKP
jgi:hypothetical protein